jgi:hypothetical protein
MILSAIRRLPKKKKKPLTAPDSPTIHQVSKTLKSLKQTKKMDDFIKKAATKHKSLVMQTNIARSILSEIINAVPILASEKVDDDLNVIKDVIIMEKVSEHEHHDLFPRLFTSTDYGRFLTVDKDMNLIQYDLPTNH